MVPIVVRPAFVVPGDTLLCVFKCAFVCVASNSDRGEKVWHGGRSPLL